VRADSRRSRTARSRSQQGEGARRPKKSEACWWPGEDELYIRYHDEEWGRPVTDDRRLFEKICLEGFQSGLSWITILRKRDNFRQAFKNFEPSAWRASGRATCSGC
jgi:hypothetical protein